MRMEIIIMIFEALGKRKYRGKPFWLHNIADSIKYFTADYYKANPSHAYGKIVAMVAGRACELRQ
jgi:hypothetical protein